MSSDLSPNTTHSPVIPSLRHSVTPSLSHSVTQSSTHACTHARAHACTYKHPGHIPVLIRLLSHTCACRSTCRQHSRQRWPIWLSCSCAQSAGLYLNAGLPAWQLKPHATPLHATPAVVYCVRQTIVLYIIVPTYRSSYPAPDTRSADQ